MKKNEENLARLLLRTQDWILAKEISNQLGFSVRSVKSYIKEINSVYPEAILSSRNGYKSNFDILSNIFSQRKRNVVETQDERTVLLLKKLIDAKRPLDLYELCDFFFVSETTVRNDLNMAKEFANERNLIITTRKNKIQLEGKERDKRMLINDLLNLEAAETLFSFDSLTDIYGTEHTDIIREIVISTFFEYDYYTNDYLLNNIVLHVIIAMDRIQNNSHLDQTVEATIDDEKAYRIAKDIAKRVGDTYDTNYADTEINDLAILVSSSANPVNFMHVDIEQLERLIGEDSTKLVQKIIEEVKENYYIDLDDSNFKVRFSLHIKNLLLRLKNSTEVKNPMTKKIKKECPLIYDCAVNVSFIIEEHTGFRLSDDEIAYLSFHLGYAIEMYKESNLKINCCLLSPVYYNMNKEILDRLDQLYSEDLSIQNVITDEKNLDNINPELIISTVKLKTIPRMPYITINPFISVKDRENISRSIEKIKKAREVSSFKGNLNTIICPDLFFINSEVKTQEEVIKVLCAELEKNHYCEDTYLDHVLKREELSSTAFGKIAIPHSVKMIGKKTGMAVLINPNGIQWGQGKVYIVLLLCIQPNDKRLFHEIFDRLSDILTEDAVVQELIESRDYNHFTNNVIGYL